MNSVVASMPNPLVSVVILCYNHSRFVEEAVISAVRQTYKPVEIVAVDDASTDGSDKILEKLSEKYTFQLIRNKKNLRNCRSFNQALKWASGKYIIDLAADDLLMPERIKKGVEVLENLPEDYGVHFCDAELIDEKGRGLKTHYQRNAQGQLREDVPQGWIFKDLLERYFICTPSMMTKKKVLDELGGYDENLSYEDFDFWVRSSKKYRYIFTDDVLVKKRVIKNSLSARQKGIFNRQISSTLKVCEKAFLLCENREEFAALLQRIKYEMKWALATGNFKETIAFYKLRARTKRRLGVYL